MRLVLPEPGEVHLRFLRPASITARPDAAELLLRYRGLLTDDERERNARFSFEAGRLEHLLARALVRTTLSRYRPGVAPEAWRFEKNDHGCPFVVGDPALRFNLSHTHGLVICAITDGRDVGVDVEPLDRKVSGADIAERFFAPAEVAVFRRTPEADKPRRFLDFWTLKEAYIKARGMGLAIPLAHFAYDVERHPVTIAFAPALDDDARQWRFAQLQPTAEHLAGVAVRDPWQQAEGPQAARITRLDEVVPLSGEL